LNFVNDNFLEETKSGYYKQLQELKELKVQYGGDIFPFIATDPRREGMGELIMEYIYEKNIFHGIKLYCPNGYSPTDKHFMDESFVKSKPLYEWCCDNKIPIMAHNSDSGFATMTNNLEVNGHVLKANMNTELYENKNLKFRFDLTNGGFEKAVKERAFKLNHPKLWEIVLKKYPNLKICLAHFGGSNKDWRDEIAKLMNKYPNVYTDLSCIRDIKVLEQIKQEFFENDTQVNKKVRDKIMYGSDYFLNLLADISFDQYYENFRSVFSEDELQDMSVVVPKKYLGI
jgi:predicted TIM-barrel fold metal-dependent hydrolase